MSATGFGPLGPRAVTARPPADADSYGGVPTWFRDCSGAGRADGTVPTASFFNFLLGNLRYAADKAGVMVTNDQTPDQDGALHAIINGIISNRLGTVAGGGWHLI